jgi:predicted nucleotidyltransferase
MATVAKELCLDFATKSSDVRGLVLLGSYAVKQSSKTSDIDLLFVLKPRVDVKKYQEALCATFKKAACVYKEGKQDGKEENNGDEISVSDFVADECVAGSGSREAVERAVITHYKCDVKSGNKTVIYVLYNGCHLFKVDCGHATDVMEKVKYIVGSEIKLRHLPDVILLDYHDDDDDDGLRSAEKDLVEDTQNHDQITKKLQKEKNFEIDEKKNLRQNRIFNQLQKVLQSADPYAASGLRDNDPSFHIYDFVENFDNCCKNIDNHDEYRTQFHLWILRHGMFCLCLLSRGMKEHVYLPKMLHKRVDLRKFHVETGDVFELLARMLLVFRSLNLKSWDEGYEEKMKSWCDFLKFRLKKSYLLRVENSDETFEAMYQHIENTNVKEEDETFEVMYQHIENTNVKEEDETFEGMYQHIENTNVKEEMIEENDLNNNYV